ncbi:MAG: helix-turn-helix domain-containing protein [Candidatus Anammoxibacter sp.]
MEDILKRLGARIREERRKTKLTQEELAKRVDLSVDFIGYIERGKQAPYIKTLERIAKALNVEIYELFIFEKNKKAKDNEAAIKKLILSLDNKKPEYMKFMSSIMKQVFERMEMKKV